jgi:hypothetical protein
MDIALGIRKKPSAKTQQLLQKQQSITEIAVLSALTQYLEFIRRSIGALLLFLLGLLAHCLQYLPVNKVIMTAS